MKRGEFGWQWKIWISRQIRLFVVYIKKNLIQNTKDPQMVPQKNLFTQKKQLFKIQKENPGEIILSSFNQTL